MKDADFSKLYESHAEQVYKFLLGLCGDVHQAEDVAWEQSLEAHILDGDSAKEIRRMIHRLPEPYKEVFLLRFYGELSFREIGETFGKSEVWGRVTYLRGKELLRTYLSERGC